MNLISTDEGCAASLSKLFASGPFFLNRIGGSDTNAAALYASLLADGKSLDCFQMRNRKRLVEEKNGYYDHSGLEVNYLAYLNMIIDSYESSKHLVFCNHQLMRMYFPRGLPPDDQLPPMNNKNELRNLVEQVEAAGNISTVYPYSFVEKLIEGQYSLFRSFEKALVGKRVLVVSPFEASMKANFSRRGQFFKKYSYPEFSLLTLNTPITYSGLPPEFYPHENWHETARSLEAAVSQMEFDIALLSCGSYALPIGRFISEVMGKQSIYVGGILQLYFGVMGRRYEGAYISSQINREAFILPIERDAFMPHVTVSNASPTESFGAYF